ncbi:EamA family transporter [Winogradskyella sp. A3E31]|uniref:EamA family transporter n=1 Tax=Winogradskyella sp. A3E31 TaxID=3349637 RepID=UPI00398AE04B
MKKQYLIVLAFFAIYVIWGSTYLWNKMAVAELDPFMLASIRFGLSGVAILAIAISLKKSIAITKKQLINSIIAGFLFLVYGNGVFVWALKYVDSGFAALETSINPLMILIIMRVYDKKPIKLKSIIGITLGVIGMYVLVSQNELILEEGSLTGILMIFTCVISWSVGSVFVSKADLPRNFFINTGYQMVAAGIMLAIGSFAFGEDWSSPLEWSSRTQWVMLCLVLFGSIAAFTSFNYLLKNVSTEKVATSGYVNPIIALLLGWYFLDEVITLQTIVAAVLLLGGVYFINSKRD